MAVLILCIKYLVVIFITLPSVEINVRLILDLSEALSELAQANNSHKYTNDFFFQQRFFCLAKNSFLLSVSS